MQNVVNNLAGTLRGMHKENPFACEMCEFKAGISQAGQVLSLCTEGMPLAGTNEQFFLGEGVIINLFMNVGLRVKCDVDLSGEESLIIFRRIAFQNIDLHVRVELFKLWQNMGQKNGTAHTGKGHVQNAFITPKNILHFGVQILFQEENLLGLFNVSQSCVGWNIFPSETVEKTKPQFLLKAGKELAERRLSDEERISGPGDILVLCNGKHIGQITKVHEAHLLMHLSSRE